MTDDAELLRQYVQAGSEDAFAELVQCHLPVVYSAALRQTDGDVELAKDICQTVFIDLGRKAGSLLGHELLIGWLFSATRFAAATVLRANRRRQIRERIAVSMHEDAATPALECRDPKLASALDAAMEELTSEDRNAVLLRFFQGEDFKDVGTALGISEDAARMRVTRAIGKLHSLLESRGVTVSAAALGSILATEAVTAVPAGLAATISAAALAGIPLATTATATATATATKAIAMTTLQKTIVAATLAAAVGTGIYEARQASNLRKENQTLWQQQAPLTEQIQQLKHERYDAMKRLTALSAKLSLRLPAPPMQVTTAPGPPLTEDLQSTNLLGRLKLGVPLTAKQLDSYLKAHRRNAASLLAAYRTSSDPALLEEAMQQYPNDPQVAFAAALKADASPESQRQWLDAFKQSAPANALANYLSALNYFKAGQTDQAVQELVAASGKQQFQDYSLTRYSDDGEAYLSAGYSVGDAEVLALFESPLLPKPTELRQLTHDIVDLANSYRQAGDEASAQTALQMAANLGQCYGNGLPGESLVSQLVGLNIERFALGAMVPGNPYGSDGQTVQDRLNQLTPQTTALSELGSQAYPILQRLSDQDWISYADRYKSFGQVAAYRWVLSKYGQ